MSNAYHRLLYPLLLLFLSGEVAAEELLFSLKFLDSTQQYRVEDPSRTLAAELVFPSENLVATLGYGHSVAGGKLLFIFEHLLAAKEMRGTDTDWYQGDVSVYSTSRTKMEGYYTFTLRYEHALSQRLALTGSLFRRYSELIWSDTKQYDYINNVYSEFTSKSVRYTQTVDGLSLGLKYQDEVFSLPYALNIAAEAGWHESVDEHLLRGFYTRTKDMLYGYRLGASAVLLEGRYGRVEALGEYGVLQGDGDMEFFTTSNFRYMSLPASFETLEKSFELKYSYTF